MPAPPPAVPLVSVVMPCAQTRWLREAVASVLAQTMPDLELIVVADGVDVSFPLEPFSADPRLRVLPLASRSTAAHARATGLREARGRWIAFCDADDLWEPVKLQVQLADPAAPTATILCSAYLRIDSGGAPLGGPLPTPRRMTYRSLLKGCPIGNSTVMIRRETLGGRLPPAVPIRCDYAFWLDLLRDGGEAIAVPHCLVQYRVHEDGISANKLRAAVWQWRILKRERLSPPQRLWYWLAYASRGIARRFRTGAYPRRRTNQPPRAASSSGG